MATETAPPRGTVRISSPENPRKDSYWVTPTAILAAFVIFIAYSTVRAFMGKYFATYHDGNVFTNWSLANTLTQADSIRPHYWSPFYDPYMPQYLPFLQNWKLGSWPISASLYVLIYPLLFRLSCYYCRRTYYRAVFKDPEACAVREKFAGRQYTGETKLPAKSLNYHRYLFYVAVILVILHWVTLYQAFFCTRNNSIHLYIGLGTFILMLDTFALTAYTFTCHSWRHLIGGAFNRLSQHPARTKIWTTVSKLNNYHGQFFWISLFTVAFADFYVYLVSSGMFVDPGIVIH